LLGFFRLLFHLFLSFNQAAKALFFRPLLVRRVKIDLLGLFWTDPPQPITRFVVVPKKINAPIRKE
jgi:hypothetical protein